MRYMPRARMPAGLRPFPISAYMVQETWEKAHELVRVERGTCAGFGYFVGELIRKAVEEYKSARKEQDEGVYEDLSEENPRQAERTQEVER
jgi:hypothetical protein